MVFADGLDRFLAVNSLPTVVIIDRAGKVAYRAEGFGEEGFERELDCRSAAGTGQKTATTPPHATSTP